jgi:hypothetical protein
VYRFRGHTLTVTDPFAVLKPSSKRCTLVCTGVSADESPT